MAPKEMAGWLAGWVGVWAKIDTVADSCLSAKFDFAFKGGVHFKLVLLQYRAKTANKGERR